MFVLNRSQGGVKTAAIFLIGLITLPLSAYAQAPAFIENGVIEASNEDEGFADVVVPPGTVSCFDYYTFGSVQARIRAEVSGTVSGAPITFSGNLVNSNPYPIVDGALYVKIFKSRGGANDGLGPDVVDQFLVEGDITIPAGGSVPVSFKWQVPAFALSGEYQLATFFTTSRKFNLLGLSFTDDVVGNTVPFTVSSEHVGTFGFDKAKVTIDNEPYFFAAFPPRKDAVSPVTVRARIDNTLGKSQRASLSWSVYRWDAQLRENVIDEEFRDIIVPEGGTDVEIVVSNSNYPVYYVVGTLSWNGAKSIIGVRFVREGIDIPRINFPGITTFPITAGQENVLFACLHNSGSAPSVENVSFDLSLTDRDGKVIHEYRYDGEVSGAMMGVESLFTPGETYDYVTLSARLYQEGEFVDEALLTYDCADIDPTLCASTKKVSPLSSIKDSIYGIGMLIFSFLLIILLLVVFRKITRTESHQLPPQQ